VAISIHALSSGTKITQAVQQAPPQKETSSNSLEAAIKDSTPFAESINYYKPSQFKQTQDQQNTLTPLTAKAEA
jgi:hypothetical protein